MIGTKGFAHASGTVSTFAFRCNQMPCIWICTTLMCVSGCNSMTTMQDCIVVSHGRGTDVVLTLHEQSVALRQWSRYTFSVGSGQRLPTFLRDRYSDTDEFRWSWPFSVECNSWPPDVANLLRRDGRCAGRLVSLAWDQALVAVLDVASCPSLIDASMTSNTPTEHFASSHGCVSLASRDEMHCNVAWTIVISLDDRGCPARFQVKECPPAYVLGTLIEHLSVAAPTGIDP